MCPSAAVIQSANGSTVAVVNDGRIEMSPVTVGLTNGTAIELRDGLAVGQQVVARAAAFLRTGDEVRPTEALDEHREAAR